MSGGEKEKWRLPCAKSALSSSCTERAGRDNSAQLCTRQRIHTAGREVPSQSHCRAQPDPAQSPGLTQGTRHYTNPSDPTLTRHTPAYHTPTHPIVAPCTNVSQSSQIQSSPVQTSPDQATCSLLSYQGHLPLRIPDKECVPDHAQARERGSNSMSWKEAELGHERADQHTEPLVETWGGAGKED